MAQGFYELKVAKDGQFYVSTLKAAKRDKSLFLTSEFIKPKHQLKTVLLQCKKMVWMRKTLNIA